MQTTDKIQMKQMVSLMLLYASVIIGWIAYYNYQPKLIAGYGLFKYENYLVWIGGLSLVITPPIAGLLGDRFREKLGNRMRIITLGVSFAAMIFMAVAFTLYINPPQSMHWLFPVLITCWLFAMGIFTSPAISTIELFSPSAKLPIAAAVLTIVADVLYSFEPVIVDIIDYVGATGTFVLGGIIVSVSGYLLRKNSLEIMPKGQEPHQHTNDSGENLANVFVIGLGLGLLSGVIFEILPDFLDNKFGNKLPFKANWAASTLLITTAVFSLPAGFWVLRRDIKSTLSKFYPIAAVLMVAIFLVSDVKLLLLVMFVFALCFSVVNVTSLPLALKQISLKRKVFGVGLFFCGYQIPEAIFEIFF